MARVVTSIRILETLWKEADKAAREGRFPGASSRSAIIELALDRLFHPEKYLPPAELEVPAE